MSLQSCLQQTLLRLVTVLDMSDVGTSKLLSFPMRYLHTLVPGSTVDGVACSEQWVLLAEAQGGRKRTLRSRNCVVSGGLRCEPNLSVQALLTGVQRPSEVSC